MSENCVAVLRLPLLLVFFFLILLLNVPTSQAASTERIWLDEAEEGRLQTGEEDDALDVKDAPEEGEEEELEEPARASNPLAPAGWWDSSFSSFSSSSSSTTTTTTNTTTTTTTSSKHGARTR
nr:unnamed protein product [Spirometra erinaceieuropaei]